MATMLQSGKEAGGAYLLFYFAEFIGELNEHAAIAFALVARQRENTRQVEA